MKFSTSVNSNSDVYYKNTYWNDIPAVYKHMCKNFTNNEKIWWVEDFKKRYAKKQFKNALFINCGNGRIEREFIDKKIVHKATAFDFSKTLLDKAKKLKKGRNINYFEADANTINLKRNTYDLVVNVAGLHHIQYINRFIYQLARCLTKKGILVNFDYIGPHRNQYDYDHWKLVNNINKYLDPRLRNEKLLYPSVPVMLDEDPTEAIHSELIIESISHYFDITEKHDTGGGLAYLLFTHNVNLFRNLNQLITQKEIKKILKLDMNFLHSNRVPSLFSYFIAAPNSQRVANKAFYVKLQNKENRREFISKLFGNVYRIQDVVSLILFNCKKMIKKLLIN